MNNKRRFDIINDVVDFELMDRILIDIEDEINKYEKVYNKIYKNAKLSVKINIDLKQTMEFSDTINKLAKFGTSSQEAAKSFSRFGEMVRAKYYVGKFNSS